MLLLLLTVQRQSIGFAAMVANCSDLIVSIAVTAAIIIAGNTNNKSNNKSISINKCLHESISSRLIAPLYLLPLSISMTNEPAVAAPRPQGPFSIWLSVVRLACWELAS